MRNLLFALLLGLSLGRLHAQSNWIWGRTCDTNSVTTLSQGFFNCTDNAGNVYITGTYQNGSITFGSYTLGLAGYADLFLVKYDPNGNVLWAKKAGSNRNEFPSGVHVDDLGNVYLTGSFNSGGLSFGPNVYLQNSHNGTGQSYDMFVTKYDANGNALWARSGVSIYDEECNDVKTDADYNVYITGDFNGGAFDMGSFHLTNTDSPGGTGDLFIAKLDSAGNYLWAKKAGGMLSEISYSIALDNSANAFIAGTFYSQSISFGSISFTSSSGFRQIFMAKYDSAGNEVWAQCTRGNGQDIARSICVDGNNNLLITGYFRSDTLHVGPFDLINTAPEDIFLAKYDNNGNAVWAREATGNYVDISNSVCTDGEGNIYITGTYESDTLDFGLVNLVAPQGSYPVFVAKYDAGGNVACVSQVFANGPQVVNHISADGNGNAYVVGTFQWVPMYVGPDTLWPTGTSNVFLAKYTCLDEVGVNEISQAAVSVYPNPNNGIFTVHTTQAAGISVLNALGQTVFRSETLGGNTQVDLGDKAAGIYFVTVKTGNDYFTQKIVVQ